MRLIQDPRLAASRRNFPAAVAFAEHCLEAAGDHYLIPTLEMTAHGNAWVVAVKNEAGELVGYIKEGQH